MLATRKILLWFERRRKSNTLNLAQEQITKAINTVNELEKALTSLANGEKTETNLAIMRLFTQESQIDKLRQAVFQGLTKDNLPTKYREDLKELVRHLDVMADNVKDAARSVKILIEIPLPRTLLEEYVTISKELSAGAKMLGDCIEMLGLDPPRAMELVNKVDEHEEKVDEGYIRIKILFFKYSSKIDAATLLELRDLIDHIEHAADRVADTAEYIRVLAAGETVM